MKNIEERVLNSSLKKLYTLEDIRKWLEYGFNIGVIKKSDEKENLEMIIKWVKLLDNKNIEI